MEDFTEDMIEREQAQQYYEDAGSNAFIESILKEDIPASKKKDKRELIDDFFSTINRNLKLSFFDETDVFIIESLFRDAIINLKMSRPSYEYDFDDMQLINQLKTTLRASLKRSVGMSTNKMNERSLQSSQIHEIRRSNSEELKTGNRGFTGSIKNMFGGN